MTYDFDKIVERRGTDCVKYDALEKVYGSSDMIPLWVADMDFETPDFIMDALRKRLEHPVLGYASEHPDYWPAVLDWQKNRNGWEIDPAHVAFIPGIVKGIGMAVNVFTKPGDKVIIQPPVYHPFRIVPEENGREIVWNPLVLTDDGYHMTSPMPTGEAAAMGMTLAMQEAGVTPAEVDYINAHGTSTGLNDKYETAAIKLAFGDEAENVKINSTKSMTGHLLGAAGAIEAIVVAKSIEEGLIHATVGYKVPDEECDLNYCVNGNIQQEINAALSNSLGFGGHNGTLCFKKVKE
jgi:hypothetical protein